MYSFKEKKIHFNALLNPDAAKYDLELLTNKQPHLTQLATYSRNPVRYANDILYLLLDNVTREEIRKFRRTRMASPIANERADEAEQRVEETELALEEEKKKEQSKPVPAKSKSTRSTRKSTGTTSSTRKSK